MKTFWERPCATARWTLFLLQSADNTRGQAEGLPGLDSHRRRSLNKVEEGWVVFLRIERDPMSTSQSHHFSR